MKDAKRKKISGVNVSDETLQTNCDLPNTKGSSGEQPVAVPNIKDCRKKKLEEIAKRKLSENMEAEKEKQSRLGLKILILFYISSFSAT